MRSRARWRELLGVLGGLVDLGHLGVLDQVIDGLGATDGLADGRHAAIGDELGLGSLDVLDAGLLELGVDVVLGDLDLELTGSQVSSVMPRAARLDRKFWPSSSKTDCS